MDNIHELIWFKLVSHFNQIMFMIFWKYPLITISSVHHGIWSCYKIHALQCKITWSLRHCYDNVALSCFLLLLYITSCKIRCNGTKSYSGRSVNKSDQLKRYFYFMRNLQQLVSCPHQITTDYRQVSNIRRTWVSNWIVDHSDAVGAPPVGAAPTISSFST